jgi:hypothetical protein
VLALVLALVLAVLLVVMEYVEAKTKKKKQNIATHHRL